MRKSDALKAELRTAFNEGNDIDYQNLCETYGIDVNIIREIARKEIEDIRKIKIEVTDNQKDLIDEKGNIKTKESLAFLQKNAQKLIEKSIADGNYHIALQAMNNLLKQVEITMKKFGEFDTKDRLGELFPEDFGDFLLMNLKREGIIEVEEENEIKGNEHKTEEQIEDINEILETKKDSINKGDTQFF